jgi:hypothetical protein
VDLLVRDPFGMWWREWDCVPTNFRNRSNNGLNKGTRISECGA